MKQEIDRNFEEFRGEWWQSLIATRSKLEDDLDLFAESYARLVSLNAWRELVLSPDAGDDVISFFVEAQNDALLSHVHAQLGCWRVALTALRGVLENLLMFVYYSSHPVELELWLAGKHRIRFSECFDFLLAHPRLQVPVAAKAVSALKHEYSTLSRAVHASSVGFRMTQGNVLPAIAVADKARAGAWVTREKAVLQGANVVLVALNAESLRGARVAGLKRALEFVLSASVRKAIKTDLQLAI